MRALIITLWLLLAAPVCSWAQTNYTEAMYRYALKDESTAPLYVLVSMQVDKGDIRQICIPAPFLLGAIHMEEHLDYDPAGEQKALDLAIKQYNKVFSFTDSKARNNVQPGYSPEVLTEVRKLLASVPDSQLRTGNYDLRKIYFKRDRQYDAYRNAVAHVLLERGILAGIGDIVPELYVLPTDAELGRQITGTWACTDLRDSTNGLFFNWTNGPPFTLTISSDGSFSSKLGSTKPLATCMGTWSVKCRLFETTITNSTGTAQGGAMPVGSVVRSEIFHNDDRILMFDRDGGMIVFSRK